MVAQACSILGFVLGVTGVLALSFQVEHAGVALDPLNREGVELIPSRLTVSGAGLPSGGEWHLR